MFLRKSYFVFWAIVIAALVPATSALAQAAHPEMIVSTEWLAAHLNDPKVVVLHVASKRDRTTKANGTQPQEVSGEASQRHLH